MTFLELAKKRMSVRKFQDRPVEEEKLRRVLEAARLAPSAHNYQPYAFIVIREGELREKVTATSKFSWLKSAPVLIVACGDHERSWHRYDGKDHCDIDVAIATDHLTLQAAELGLGTCWVCLFDALQCHEILGLPDHLEPVALIPIGYPAVEGERESGDKKRLALAQMVHWDRYQAQ
jgi:nitroreductase